MREEIENKQIAEDFEKWANEPIEKNFEKYSPLGNEAIVRLYYFDAGKYQKGKPQILMDTSTNRTARSEMESRLFSIGKILSVGESVTGGWANLNPGDLVTVQDMFTGSRLNDDWVEYKAMLKEKPSMAKEINEPPKMVGNISGWKGYVFAENKFTETPNLEDAFTFLIPVSFIKTRYGKA